MFIDHAHLHFVIFRIERNAGAFRSIQKEREIESALILCKHLRASTALFVERALILIEVIPTRLTYRNHARLRIHVFIVFAAVSIRKCNLTGVALR